MALFITIAKVFFLPTAKGKCFLWFILLNLKNTSRLTPQNSPTCAVYNKFWFLNMGNWKWSRVICNANENATSRICLKASEIAPVPSTLLQSQLNNKVQNLIRSPSHDSGFSFSNRYATIVFNMKFSVAELWWPVVRWTTECLGRLKCPPTGIWRSNYMWCRRPMTKAYFHKIHTFLEISPVETKGLLPSRLVL